MNLLLYGVQLTFPPGLLRPGLCSPYSLFRFPRIEFSGSPVSENDLLGFSVNRERLEAPLQPPSFRGKLVLLRSPSALSFHCVLRTLEGLRSHPKNSPKGMVKYDDRKDDKSEAHS